MTELLTVGHGTLPAEELGDLLRGAGVERLVDVRSFPGSRRNPQFAREALERWLPDAGVDYRWIRELGGRRRPVPGSKHHALRVDAFRAYADHMETEDFAGGVHRLLELAAGATTAVMCSESVWWRCHRRLLADHLVLVRGVAVSHLMHDGRVSPHRVTDGARAGEGERAGEGAVVYDVGVTPPLPD